MELAPWSGILQPPIALISSDPCFTSSEPPGTLRNLLMRSNNRKFQVFNQLWMHGWRVQLNPLEKMYINKISDEPHTWFSCCFSMFSPLPLLIICSLFTPAPHFPSALIFIPPAFTQREWASAAPLFKNAGQAECSPLIDSWFLSKPSPTLIFGFHLGMLERLFLAISTPSTASKQPLFPLQGYFWGQIRDLKTLGITL